MEGPAQIAPGLWGLGTDIVNWHLVEDGDRLTAVDAGLPGFARTLETDLEQIGRSPDDIEALVLTHADGDHTGLAGRLRDRGTRVLVHADDRELLRRPGPKGGDASVRRLVPQLRHRSTRRIAGHILRNGGARPPRIEDPETFAGGDALEVPGHPRAIHTPGHTAGHCALLFEGAGALFVGDALIRHELVAPDRCPRLMPSHFNVSTAQALASLAALEGLDAELVLFGHGQPWREGPAAAVASARAVASAVA